MRPPRSRTSPNAGTPSRVKRNSVRDARVPGSAPAMPPAAVPASRLGSSSPGRNSSAPAFTGRPSSPNTVDTRTVSKGNGVVAVAGTGRVGHHELLAVCLGARWPARRRPSAARPPWTRPSGIARRITSPTGPQRWVRTAGRLDRAAPPADLGGPGGGAQLRVTVQPGRSAGRRRGGLREAGGRGQRVQVELDPGRRRVEQAASSARSGCSIVSCSGPAAACSQVSTPAPMLLRHLEHGLPVREHQRAHARPARRRERERSAPRPAATRPAPARRRRRGNRRGRSAPARRRARSSLRRVGLRRRQLDGWWRCRRVRGGLRAWPLARGPCPRGPPMITRAHPSRVGRSIMRVSRPTERCARGWDQQEQPDRVGDEARRQQERPSEDDQHAVEDLPVRDAALRQGALERRPRTPALPARAGGRRSASRRSGSATVHSAPIAWPTWMIT